MRPDPELSPLRTRMGQLRQDQELTYEALAERAGLSRSVVIRCETGVVSGHITTWLQIARGLGVPLSELTRDLK